MAIFRFVDAIANDRPIDIYGTGAMCRDFTYIDDLVGAVDRLIKIAPVEESRVKVNGIVDTLSSNAPYRVVNIGGGDPASAPSAAISTCSWMTPLDKGIERFVAWYRSTMAGHCQSTRLLAVARPA